MIVDLQGQDYCLTDPIIITLGKDLKDEDSDTLNSGKLGMGGFFRFHECNKYCKELKLEDPKNIL